MRLDEVELHPVRVPMRLRFRRVSWREAVLLQGPAGWGEFSPFPEYPPEVTSPWLAAALHAACAPRPEPRRDRVEVNVTVPAIGPEEAGRHVLESGCRTAKVKVAEPGQSPEEDVARVRAVREALGDQGRLRVDANGAWGVEEAARRLAPLLELGLEYVEQPVATLEEMAELRRRVDVPLAADELVRRLPDPLQLAEAGAADLLVLKVQPLGGVDRVLELAARCGLPVVVSSALETSVGLSAGLVLAAALPELPYACGLGTATLLAGDVSRQPLVPEDGELEVREVRPDPELIEEWRPDPGTEARLMRRLRQAADLLGP